MLLRCLVTYYHDPDVFIILCICVHKYRHVQYDTYSQKSIMYTVCTYVCVYLCVYICVCMCVYVHISLNMCICIHVCVQVQCMFAVKCSYIQQPLQQQQQEHQHSSTTGKNILDMEPKVVSSLN